MTRPVPHGWQLTENDKVFELTKGTVVKDFVLPSAPNAISYLLIDSFIGAENQLFTNKSGLKVCDENDPVLVMDGSRSGLVLRGQAGAIGSTLAAVKPLNGSLDKGFLFYYLLSLYPLLNHGKTAGAVPHTDRQLLMSLPILLPPLPEQEGIAAVLGSVDATIDATKQVIAQTRQLKRALMQTLLTRGLPGQHTQFKPSPLGTIPADWEVIKLQELLAPIDTPMRSGPFGSALKKEELSLEGVPFLGIDNIHRERFVGDFKRFVPEDKAKQLSRFLVKPQDIVITIMGTVGRCCIIPENIGLALSSKHIWTITLDSEKYDPHLACWQFNYAPWVLSHFSQGGQGAVMEAISSSVLRNTLLPKPPMSEQQAMVKVLQSLDARLAQENETLARLKTLKTALMQVLLTGQVRVPVALSVPSCETQRSLPYRRS